MDQILTIVSDLLLGVGAIGAGIYCIVLARRLKRFNNLENGVGGAVAVLSVQVDDMTKTLEQARKAAEHSSNTLTQLTERAEESARKLEIMMAALHDLPDPPERSSAHSSSNSTSVEMELDTEWASHQLSSNVKRETPTFSTRRVMAGGVR